MKEMIENWVVKYRNLESFESKNWRLKKLNAEIKYLQTLEKTRRVPGICRKPCEKVVHKKLWNDFRFKLFAQDFSVIMNYVNLPTILILLIF